MGTGKIDNSTLFYDCDPKKNVDCKKVNCFIHFCTMDLHCHRTSKKECAYKGAVGHTAREWEVIDSAKPSLAKRFWANMKEQGPIAWVSLVVAILTLISVFKR